MKKFRIGFILLVLGLVNLAALFHFIRIEEIDKVYHWLAGLVLGILLFRLGIMGLILGSLVIVGYEILQFSTGIGTAEVWDIIAGFISLFSVFIVLSYLGGKRDE